MSTKTVLKGMFRALAACGVLAVLAPAAPAAQPPDLTAYQTMAQDSLKLVAAGDMAGAKKKVAELEAKWDASPLHDALPQIDGQMDVVKEAVNSGDAKKATAELNTYLQMVDKASKPAAH
jgi:hypothetical protein